jgi:cell division control protein 6
VADGTEEEEEDHFVKRKQPKGVKPVAVKEKEVATKRLPLRKVNAKQPRQERSEPVAVTEKEISPKRSAEVKPVEVQSTPKRSPLGRVDVNIPTSPEVAEVQVEAAPDNRMPMRSRSKSPPPPSTAVTAPFDVAKQLFHKATVTRIVGRSTERLQILRFWEGAIASQSDSPQQKRILYVCGNPGTGKTAVVEEMLPGLVASVPHLSLRIVKRNCMMYESTGDLVKEIAGELAERERTKKPGRKKKDVAQELCDQIHRSLMKTADSGYAVLVLDEIDRLAEDDSALLGRLLGWARDPALRLLVIGIANSIDLTHRYIPASLLPATEACFFPPYATEDITAILTDRLQTANERVGGACSLIQPLAIELCARKIAAVGDLRRALEVMQLAIDEAQRDWAGRDPANVPCVEFKHVLAAMAKALPSSAGSDESTMVDQLNMNARLVLVALVLFQRENPVPAGTRLPYKRATLQALYEAYVRMLRGGDMARGAMLLEPVGRDEFLVLLSDMETFGVITITPFSQGAAKRTVGRSVSAGQLLDWQGSVVKFALPDATAVVEALKGGAVTNMFIS